MIIPRGAPAEVRNYIIFMRQATNIARKLRRFFKFDFCLKWREANNKQLTAGAFGYGHLEELIKSIPGVRSVHRTGEPVKFYFYEPDLEEMEENDDEDEGSNEEEEADLHDSNDEDEEKQYEEVLKVARTLPSPFTEAALHEALAKYHHIEKKKLTWIGQRKVPVFLEIIPGIKYIKNGGKYECYSVSEKGEDRMDSEENEKPKESSPDGDMDEMSKRKEGNGNNDIIENGSDSKDEELAIERKKKDPVRSPKMPMTHQKDDSPNGEQSVDSSADVEEKKKSSGEDDPSKYVKEEPAEVSKKRSRGRGPVIFIKLESSEDEGDPAPKKSRMETAGFTQNSAKLGPVASENVPKRGNANGENNGDAAARIKENDMSNIKLEVPEEARARRLTNCNESMQEDHMNQMSMGDCSLLQQGAASDEVHGLLSENVPQPIASSSSQEALNNSLSSHSSTATNPLASGISPQMMPPIFQPQPNPNEQLLQIAGQLQILMQQVVHGGAVPYMNPGQQTMPPFAPIPAAPHISSPAATGNISIPLIDLEVEVKEEDTRSISSRSGRIHQVTNCQPPIMNPGIQNAWGQPMPFGIPHSAPSMFQPGLAGGYSAPVMPGFGHPLQPQMPQMVAPPSALLPSNILDFLGHYMGPTLSAALDQGADPLELAKKVLENVYGSQQKPSSSQQ